MIINHNMNALNAHRNLIINQAGSGKAMEKLSSGLRINRAGDDAAGLAISEKMRGQIRGLEQASRNSQDGISMIQTAEGALNEVHSIAQRIRELVVQGNNGSNKLDDQQKIQKEIDELVKEVTSIGNKTQFNKQNLLDGTLGATYENNGSDLAVGTGALKIVDVTGAKVGVDYQVTGGATSLTVTSADGNLSQTIDITDATAVNVGDRFHFEALGITLEAQLANVSTVGSTAANGQFDVSASGIVLQTGANANQFLAISINDMRADQLGSAGIKLTDIDVTDFANSSFDNQIAAVDDAISLISDERSKMGAWQNRLEHTIANLNTSAENLTSAESRIRDVDMAKEMMEFSKKNILAQASQAMLAQANQQPQNVLQLLR